LKCGLVRFLGVLLAGWVLWQQAGAQNMSPHFSCTLYENPSNPHNGGGNGTVWYHDIIVGKTTGKNVHGVLAADGTHFIYKGSSILLNHYGRHQQLCHLAFGGIPAGYNFFVDKARVYIAPGAPYSGQTVWFEGRSHYIYNSSRPEIGYIVKYNSNTGWKALNADMGTPVLAVTDNTQTQAIWDFSRRSFRMISPEAEIQVYLVSKVPPSEITGMAATGVERTLSPITQGSVEFDGHLAAQPTTIPSPYIDYSVKTYAPGGGYGGFHSYRFRVPTTVDPPTVVPPDPIPPAPPPIVATCSTSSIVPFVVLQDGWINALGGLATIGEQDLVFTLNNCKNISKMRYRIRKLGAWTNSWGLNTLPGTEAAVYLDLYSDDPAFMGTIPHKPRLIYFGVGIDSTNWRTVLGPFDEHSIHLGINYTAFGSGPSMKPGRVIAAMRIEVEYE